MTLACESVRLAGSRQLTVLIDPTHEFFPAGLSGLDLQRVVVVRPQHRADVLWTLGFVP